MSNQQQNGKGSSTNVGEMEKRLEEQQRAQQQRIQLQPVSSQVEHLQQQSQQPSQVRTTVEEVEVPVETVTTVTKTTGGTVRATTMGQQFGAYGAGACGVNIGGQPAVINEPTIDLFNRFVAKDTHCLLGKTGIKISRICLGTMNFGSINPKFGERPGQLDEAQAHKILDRFLELGGNCIDTADFFPWFGPDVGKAESIIGNWLSKQNREKVFLITKVRMPQDIENINSVGLSRGHLIDSVNQSLKRLQTDTIDMLVLNGWDPTVSFHETVRHLNDLVQEDKVRYIGVCDMKGWQVQKLIDSAKNLNMHKCVCYIGEYNLLTRGCELEVLDVCKKERIGFIAYSPLKYGFLTNETVNSLNERKPVKGSRIEAATKHQQPREQQPSEKQPSEKQPSEKQPSQKQPSEQQQSYKLNLAAMAESFECISQNPVYLNVLNVCSQLARKYNCSVSQIAIQWILQKGVVTSVCVGVEDVNELEHNMSCLLGEVVLSQQDMDLLDSTSSVHLHYPYRTQLAEVAGFRTLRPLTSTEFEQLNVLTHALEIDSQREQRFSLGETWHESISQPLPEREFMRYPQQKAQQIQQQQFPMGGVNVPSSFATGMTAPGQQQNLINPAKIIQ